MATVVKMPKWGLTMTSGIVTDWLRDEGSELSEGDPLLTVETEKAVNDVEAPTDGVLLKIIAGPGAEIPVSGPIAIIAAPGETLSADDIQALIDAASPKKAAAAAKSGAAGPARETRAASRDASGRVNASPAARKLAGELGIDLASVEATGPGGRITSDDVQRTADERDADPTPRQLTVALADGRTLAALVAGAGSGPPLVFLHGLSGSQSTWQVVLGDLVDGHKVAAFDLPGHGASSKEITADYTLAGLGGAVAEAMRELKLTQAIVVGHSLGGAVALELATAHSELVTGLVLINSAGLGAEISPTLIDLMQSDPGAATARALLELFYEDQRLVLDRGVEEMAAAQLAAGAWQAQQQVSALAFDSGGQRASFAGRLHEVRQPVLIIWGERDRVIPLSHALAALTAGADVTLRVLPGIGHVPQVENATAVATAIDRFAKGLA